MPPATAGPPWLQTLLSVVGILGGLGGVAAAATVLIQRRKLKADAADVLSGAAVVLVAPLKGRIAELQTEVQDLRVKLRRAHDDLDGMQDSVRDTITLMRHWRSEVLAPDATLEHLREMVRTAPSRPVNGLPRRIAD